MQAYVKIFSFWWCSSFALYWLLCRAITRVWFKLMVTEMDSFSYRSEFNSVNDNENGKIEKELNWNCTENLDRYLNWNWKNHSLNHTATIVILSVAITHILYTLICAVTTICCDFSATLNDGSYICFLTENAVIFAVFCALAFFRLVYYQ